MLTFPTPKKVLDDFQQLEALNSLTAEAFAKNEKIKQRQASELAKKIAAQKEYEAEIRNMALRQQKKEQEKQQRAIAQMKAGRKRIRVSISKADEAFSLCVRLRANCTCERCGENFPPRAMKHLHCSHNYSREYQQVRFHPDNAFALCKDCHKWFANHKMESTAWKNEMLGDQRLRTVFKALQDGPSKISKVEEKRIAAYYRIIARYLMAEREKGNREYLPFKGYGVE